MFQSGRIISQFRGPWGLRIELDQSLILLLGFLLYMSLRGSLLDGVLLCAIIVMSILLHELGHAWGCLVQGVSVRRVVLHGGGGFCEHARSPNARQQELIVLMGPLVNLALWAILGIVFWAMLWLPYWIGAMPGDLWYDAVLWVMFAAHINLALFVFNLIPVQPLDGGKLFHLALLRVLPAPVAHRVTGGVGFVLSILWFPAAVVLYLTLGFILFFFPNPMAHWRMMRGDLAF